MLEEDAPEYFESIHKSPYMLLVDRVCPQRRISNGQNLDVPLEQWVNIPRSDVPAVTHVDYSARVQTVARDSNPGMWGILDQFKKLTGYAILVNTSFNVRSEPIVCTPEDAYRCFMRTGIDLLVLDNFVLEKSEQSPWNETSDWQKQFVLD